MSVDVVTFGCRLNACESEVIRREAQAAGLADTLVVNTCAVTAEAVRQARQAIRKAKREEPQRRIWRLVNAAVQRRRDARALELKGLVGIESLGVWRKRAHQYE